jgi:hypothetical protein
MKAAATLGPSTRKKAGKLPRAPPPLPKRTYDKSDKEIDEAVAAYNKQHFAPKKPEEKPVYDPKTKKWVISFLEQPSQEEINRKDDYTRCLKRVKRSGKSRTTSSGASGRKHVAQLGEQANQSISPLKVPRDDQVFTATLEQIRAAEFAKEAGITLSQLEGGEIQAAKEVWKWQYGKPLVEPQLVKLLPTHMRKLHDWYLDICKEDRRTIVVKVTAEHFTGRDEIQIYLDELYMLYKLDALDLSIMATYCL